MKKHIQKFRKEILTAGRGVALASTLLLITSGFLPWGYTKYVSVAGTAGDGVIIIGIGVVAFLMLFFKKIHRWVSLICGIGGLVIGIIDFVAMRGAVSQFSGYVGTGLYLTVLSSLGVVVGIVIEIMQERKKMNLFYLDK